MIIYRYLSRQLLATTLAVSFVLVVILVSGRFIKYFADAAEGRLVSDLLFLIMAYRLPGFLELILPLGFFLGVLLTYGRLYLDNEMTVLSACGVSQLKVTSLTIVPALCMAATVGLFSLYLAPWGLAKTELIFEAQDVQAEFQAIMPGRFHGAKGNGRVTYIESLGDDDRVMKNVFISEARSKQLESNDGLVVVVAQQGRSRVDPITGVQYLDLYDGYRYEGTPGEPDYRRITYEKYTLKLAEPSEPKAIREVKALTTSALLKKDSLIARAELQWRVSIPVLVVIVSLLAVPLSRVDARQGRFFRLLPSILIYLVYLSLLIGAKGWVEKEKISPNLGLWWVHGLFLSLAVLLLFGHGFRRWLTHLYKRNHFARLHVNQEHASHGRVNHERVNHE